MNPFTISFGKIPECYIPRNIQLDLIIDDFLSKHPLNSSYIITGLRGSGKTVALTELYKQFQSYDDWIVLDTNSERNILEDLAEQLKQRQTIRSLLSDLSFSLDVPFLQTEGNKKNSSPSVIYQLQQMLEKLTRSHKNILITLDEAAPVAGVKQFIAEFQSWLRKEYSVFLLMTGLHENIYDLQNQKTLTFLYRTPKIYLQPLNLRQIQQTYTDVLCIPSETAAGMAEITQGYPYAFQVLGYLSFKYPDKSLEEILPHFDDYMAQYVYEKIWSEISPKEQQILLIMAEHQLENVSEIRSKAEMKSNTFGVYRKRLLTKGIILAKRYGSISLVLPRFDTFILNMKDDDNFL